MFRPLRSVLLSVAAIVLAAAIPAGAQQVASPGIPLGPFRPLPSRDAEDRSPISPEDRQLLRSLWPDLPTEGVYQYPHWAPRWLEWLHHRSPDAPSEPSGLALEGEVNVTNSPQVEAESFVAVDFDDPRFVLAAANDFNGPQGLYASTDGGHSWLDQSMPRGGFSYHSDPGVGWDTAGNGYTVTLGIKGGQVKPIVSKSTDRGATWSTPVIVPSANSIDKELLWVDPLRSSPCRDFVYVGWDQPGASVKLSRSTDGGTSWSSQVTLDKKQGIGTSLSSGPHGEVYAAWSGLDKTIRTAHSFDCGAHFEEPVTLSPTNQPYDIGIPSFCRRRALVYPAIDVDRSAGCRSGWVYAAWVDSTAGGNCSVNGCPARRAAPPTSSSPGRPTGGPPGRSGRSSTRTSRWRTSSTPGSPSTRPTGRSGSPSRTPATTRSGRRPTPSSSARSTAATPSRRR